MGPNDLLPRLLRLHGALARVAPNGSEHDSSDGDGLTEAYRTLRESARGLVEDMGIPAGDFDREMPQLEHLPEMGRYSRPEAVFGRAHQAATALTRLRTLRGYVEGLLSERVVADDLTPDQVATIERLLVR